MCIDIDDVLYLLIYVYIFAVNITYYLCFRYATVIIS